jgi:hypothetical protein
MGMNQAWGEEKGRGTTRKGTKVLPFSREITNGMRCDNLGKPFDKSCP